MKSELKDTLVMAIYTAQETDKPLAEIIDTMCEQENIPHSDIRKAMQYLSDEGFIIKHGKCSLYSVGLTKDGLQHAEQLSKSFTDKMIDFAAKQIPDIAKILIQYYLQRP